MILLLVASAFLDRQSSCSIAPLCEVVSSVYSGGVNNPGETDKRGGVCSSVISAGKWMTPASVSGQKGQIDSLNCEQTQEQRFAVCY